MKNHFYISYNGNKRNEAENFYNSIDLSQIKTIIEPFVGTGAISYYIQTKNPDLKFILNDNNKFIIEMYNIMKDDEKLKAFEDKINLCIRAFLINCKIVKLVKRFTICIFFDVKIDFLFV